MLVQIRSKNGLPSMSGPGHKDSAKLLPIGELKPTQMTVGYREVGVKGRSWKAARTKSQNPEPDPVIVPVVAGPQNTFYLIDRHHLTFALFLEGVETVLAEIVEDFAHLPPSEFWQKMWEEGWCRPVDETGRKRAFEDMPGTIKDLKDDPYRSLAGAVRRAKGYAKGKTPYSEFQWADFLRNHVSEDCLSKDFQAAVEEALQHARTPDAAHLPGYVPGPEA